MCGEANGAGPPTLESLSRYLYHAGSYDVDTHVKKHRHVHMRMNSPTVTMGCVHLLVIHQRQVSRDLVHTASTKSGYVHTNLKSYSK